MHEIGVHPLSGDPTAAWDDISKRQKCIKLKTKLPSKPPGNDKVRFVCMSDTHSLVHDFTFEVPEGDVLIHAGNFTMGGHLQEIVNFNAWLGTLPHKYKIVICGNHELTFDPKFSHLEGRRYQRTNHRGLIMDNKEEKSYEIFDPRQYLTNCIYLEDSSIELYGIKIYGTPWQPAFGNWAFNLKRGEELLQKWNLIPDDTDILVTHTPPIGHGDLVCSNIRAGCVDLLSVVQQRIKPKYHVFGHIHEDYGVSTDGKIIYVNGSICDINYMPNNLPIVFDVTKQENRRKNQ